MKSGRFRAGDGGEVVLCRMYCIVMAAECGDSTFRIWRRQAMPDSVAR